MYPRLLYVFLYKHNVFSYNKDGCIIIFLTFFIKKTFFLSVLFVFFCNDLFSVIFLKNIQQTILLDLQKKKMNQKFAFFMFAFNGMLPRLTVLHMEIEWKLIQIRLSLTISYMGVHVSLGGSSGGKSNNKKKDQNGTLEDN